MNTHSSWSNVGGRLVLLFLATMLVLLFTWLAGCGRVVPEDATKETVELTTSQRVLERIALEHDDPSVRAAAVRKLKDQELLAKIAIEDANEKVRDSATKRIGDSRRLDEIAEARLRQRRADVADRIAKADATERRRIALHDEDLLARKAALETLDDPSLLMRIALEEADEEIAALAVWRIESPSLLVQVALEAESFRIRETAIHRLDDPACLAEVAVGGRNREDRTASLVKLAKADAAVLEKVARDNPQCRLLLVTVLPAFASIPEKHRSRLTSRIIPVIDVLRDEEVARHVGKIEAMTIHWQGISAPYRYLVGSEGQFAVPGERVSCSIEVDKLSQYLSVTWETEFPDIVSEDQFPMGIPEPVFRPGGEKKLTDFIPATIRLGELLVPAFERLPIPLVEKIATRDETPEIRAAAFEKLPTSTLVRIATHASRPSIRREAVDCLHEERVLATIARGDKDVRVRCAATRRLTDQRVLAAIATQDQAAEVRRAAIAELTHVPLLEKIAEEDTSRGPRREAEQRLQELEASGP